MLCQCNSTTLKPTYTLSGSGNSLCIIFTTHEGISCRCPFPKKLWVQLVNRRYAANLLYYITSHTSANLLAVSNSTASPLTVCIVTRWYIEHPCPSKHFKLFYFGDTTYARLFQSLVHSFYLFAAKTFHRSRH